MSKQVYVKGLWHDVISIKQDGDIDNFIVKYQDSTPCSVYTKSSHIRDKPGEEVKIVDWDKPLQIKCGGGGWHDVIFHKIYNIEVLKDGFCDTRISLIFEKDGEPVYVQDILRDLTIRNKAPSLTFEKWVVYNNDGIHNICSSKSTADKLLLRDRQFKIKHIKVEWENA